MQLTRSLAEPLMQRGIRICALCPQASLQAGKPRFQACPSVICAMHTCLKRPASVPARVSYCSVLFCSVLFCAVYRYGAGAGHAAGECRAGGRRDEGHAGPPAHCRQGGQPMLLPRKGVVAALALVGSDLAVLPFEQAGQLHSPITLRRLLACLHLPLASAPAGHQRGAGTAD